MASNTPKDIVPLFINHTIPDLKKQCQAKKYTDAVKKIYRFCKKVLDSNIPMQYI